MADPAPVRTVNVFSEEKLAAALSNAAEDDKFPIIRRNTMRNLIERARIAVRDWLTAPDKSDVARWKSEHGTLRARFESGIATDIEARRYRRLAERLGFRIRRRRDPLSGTVRTCVCGALDGSDCGCFEGQRKAGEISRVGHQGA